MKRWLVFLSAIVISAYTYAGTTLELAISPAIDVASFITSKEGTAKVNMSDDVSKGLYISAGMFGDVCRWLSIGGTAAVDARSLIEMNGAFITIPAMAAIRFSYSMDRLEIPLTLMAGGHAQIAGDKLKFGPCFAISAGISVGLSDNIYLDISTWAALAMQFSDDGRTSYQVTLRPVSIGAKARF